MIHIQEPRGLKHCRRVDEIRISGKKFPFMELDSNLIQKAVNVTCSLSNVLGDIGSFQAVWCPGEGEAPPWWVSHGGGSHHECLANIRLNTSSYCKKGIVYIYINIHMGEWFPDIHICNIIYMYTRFLWHNISCIRPDHQWLKFIVPFSKNLQKKPPLIALNQHTSIHNPQFSQIYKYSPIKILKSPQKTHLAMLAAGITSPLRWCHAQLRCAPPPRVGRRGVGMAAAQKAAWRKKALGVPFSDILLDQIRKI